MYDKYINLIEINKIVIEYQFGSRMALSILVKNWPNSLKMEIMWFASYSYLK